MKFSLFFIIITAFAVTVFSGANDVVCRFKSPVINDEGVYQKISLYDCDNLVKTGEPALPYKKVRILLPTDAENIEIIPKSDDYTMYNGNYVIVPAQPIQLGPYKAPGWSQDDELYGSTTLYPKNSTEIISVGNQADVKIVDIFVYPVRYSPLGKKIYVAREISFTVKWDSGLKEMGRRASWAIQTASVGAVNKDEIHALPRALRKRTKTLAETTCKYYIITSSDLSTRFQKLAAWKMRKGINTKVVTTASIYSSYTGKDNQDKIRKFIKEKQQQGAEYVLLGGDNSIIPARNVYPGALPVPTPPGYDKPACDLYYSDCDGTWDADGDGIYGESSGDGLDMYPDILVGRASVESVAECDAFIDKVLNYEKSPASGYIKNAFFGSINDRGEENHANKAANFVPSSWTIKKLYQSNGTYTKDNWISTFNNGFGFGMIVSHGEPEQIKINQSQGITASDVANFANVGKYPVMTAVNCLIGCFDGIGQSTNDCVVEHLMYKKDAGTVAFVANSRLGTPAEGATLKYNVDFFQGIFKEGLTTLGQVYAFTKTENIAKAKTSVEHSYALCELNLHGDPSMALWTDEPKAMAVTATNPFSENSGIRVTAKDGTNALDSALVCIMWKDNSDIEATGYTDSNGAVSFDIDRKSGYDSLWVTVTKHNFLPVEKTLAYNQSTALTRHLQNENRSGWRMHSNGNRNVLTRNAPLEESQNISVAIFDMAGRVLYNTTYRLDAGEQSITMNPLHAFKGDGMRIIRIKIGNRAITLRQIS